MYKIIAWLKDNVETVKLGRDIFLINVEGILYVATPPNISRRTSTVIFSVCSMVLSNLNIERRVRCNSRDNSLTVVPSAWVK